MPRSSVDLPIEPTELSEFLPELGEATPQPSLFTRIRKSPYLLMGMIFGAGLLSGWLVLGLYLWQSGGMAWSSSQYPPGYEQMYMTWVANRYAQTGDFAQVQKDLATWSRDDIARVLASLQKETVDPEMRRRFAVLADLLGVPVASTSLQSSLFAQPIFLIGIFLSFTLLLVAIALIAVPVSLERQAPADELPPPVEPLDANLEELLTDVQIGALEQTPEKKEEEKKEEEKKEEEKKEEDSDSSAGGLGDLASLFEEEDTSLSTLEAFCKGLAEVNIDELLNLGKNIVQRFKTQRYIPPANKDKL